MPINYQVHDDGELVYAIASGTFNARDSIKYQESVACDLHVKSGYKMVLDTTRIKKIKLTGEDIERITDIALSNPKNTKKMKVAIIANTMIVFELCKYYDMLSADNENINIFNDMSTARTWLGVS